MSNDEIAIVSGFPRSGTSMMMQMLEAGGVPALTDHIRSSDDDNLEGYFEFEPVKRTKHDASWLMHAKGKVVKVIYLLLYDLPAAYNYRVIFMRRDLSEVLASQRKMLERRGETGATVSEEKLAEIFGEQQKQVDDWLAKQPNFKVLHVLYREVVTDPAGQASRISGFLDATLNVEAMSAAVNPDLYRQRGSS